LPTCNGDRTRQRSTAEDAETTLHHGGAEDTETSVNAEIAEITERSVISVIAALFVFLSVLGVLSGRVLHDFVPS
jgi:hypothetical protein